MTSSIITTWPKKSFLEIPIIWRSLSFWEWGLREYGKFPIYKRSKIDYLTLAWDQSPVIAWGGGGGESEEQEGAEVGGFWGWMACFLGESGQLYSETTKSSDSPPPPPFPSGNKHDRFFNRKLWCVHRPLLYGISETFPYSTIFICLFQCDSASIKWLVLV